MNIQVAVPTRVLLDTACIKIVAESENGSFCLLPRHVDYLATLVPSLIAYTTPGGEEMFVAVDEGLLIKQGANVYVSTRQAICGGDLGELREVVQDEFLMLDERQRACHAAIASLEANFVRRFLELEDHIV